MLYYPSVYLVTCINLGLGKTVLTWDLQYPGGSSDYEYEDSSSTRRVLRGLNDGFTTDPLQELQDTSETQHINLLPKIENRYSRKFDDVFWPFQWYMHDQRTVLGPVMDHNVVPVYEAGYTGKGVIVGVIGDGVKRGLVDLPNVIEPVKSDTESKKYQKEPDYIGEEKMSPEGTMMAGVIAMKANNKKCGVGVAYDAAIVGIKVASQKSSQVADSVFERAITYDKFKGQEKSGTLCDIYTFAIGRPDDGMFVPGTNTKLAVETAFTRGLSKGRKGKGSIYVVGAGNGKKSTQDNCGADDLVNDPATIAIASADHRGMAISYSERCAAVMATAYSSGNNQGMVAPDVDGSCTNEYSGNNPSVGIAAGIFALALQANKELTARDIQHLVAMTSEVAPLVENKGTWMKNAAGFYVSSDFGFGLLNAKNMVTAATNNWVSVFPNFKEVVSFKFSNSDLAKGKIITGTVSHSTIMQYLELVEIRCDVYLEYRGSIQISLQSPSGTEVVMLEPRPRDSAISGLQDWRIKTAHFWGELPKGTWILTATIVNQSKYPVSLMVSIVNNIRQRLGQINKIQRVTLTLHGNEAKQPHYKMRTARNKDLRTTYSGFRNGDLQHGSYAHQFP